MKKFLILTAVVLALSVSMTVLAACGGGKTSAAPDDLIGEEDLSYTPIDLIEPLDYAGLHVDQGLYEALHANDLSEYRFVVLVSRLTGMYYEVYAEEDPRIDEALAAEEHPRSIAEYAPYFEKQGIETIVRKDSLLIFVNKEQFENMNAEDTMLLYFNLFYRNYEKME